MSRIGGLFGVAVLGIVMVHSFNGELDRRLARMEATPEGRRVVAEQRVRLAGAELPFSLDDRARSELQQAINKSFVAGFRLVMLAAAGLALVSAFVAFKVVDNK